MCNKKILLLMCGNTRRLNKMVVIKKKNQVLNIFFFYNCIVLHSELNARRLYYVVFIASAETRI